MNTKSRWAGTACALLLGFAVVGSMGLQGCATPKAREQVAVAILVNVAVGRVVEKGTDDSAVWAERAAKISTIATTVQGLGEDTFADVATVVAALQPIFERAGLSPSEQLTARTLAATLLQLVNEREENGELEGVKATVFLILEDVKQACAIYGAAPG